MFSNEGPNIWVPWGFQLLLPFCWWVEMIPRAFAALSETHPMGKKLALVLFVSWHKRGCWSPWGHTLKQECYSTSKSTSEKQVASHILISSPHSFSKYLVHFCFALEMAMACKSCQWAKDPCPARMCILVTVKQEERWTMPSGVKHSLAGEGEWES